MNNYKSFFTIIVPTFNRPEYIKRLLGFYARSSSNDKFKIIVADSSSESNKIINKQIIDSFTNLNILYLNDFQSNIHPNIKILNSLGFVKTKYCVACPDDDFVIIEAINKAVTFFEKNSGFTCIHGKYIRFYFNENDKINKFSWHFVYSSNSIIMDDVKERVINHFSYPINMLYAVYKTDFLKMIHEYNKRYLGDSFFGEEFLSIAPLFYGKMQIFDCIFAIKDAQSTPQVTNKEDKNHFAFPNDYKRQGVFEKKYSQFIDISAKHLSKCTHDDINDSKQFLNNIYNHYLNKNFDNITTNFSFVFHHIRFLLDSIRLPIFLDKYIRWTYKRLFLLRGVKLLKTIPSDEYYDCLRDLKEYLISRT